jgi:predicted transcriptional regulator
MKNENERIEALLALILARSFKGESMAAPASALSVAGFTNVEIADLLQTSPQTITQLLYEKRKKRRLRKQLQK